MGRPGESRAVEHLLMEARAGRSGVLVVRGDAGMGKTALLEHLRDAAVTSRFRVEFSTGVEAETQFAFAGLHQFCAPFLDHVEALPDPQRVALGVALGSVAGPTPDRFLVGLATLNLIAEVAETAPLVCIVDDAQWLDQASAEVLAFVARRVDAEQLVVVFGKRGGGPSVFSELPELLLTGLDDEAARELLDNSLRAPLDDDVRERIIDEARGNPLALLELPSTVSAAGRGSGFELADMSDVPGQVESGFQRRSADLPEQTQLLLLAAAAEPTGDPLLLFRATAALGIASESITPAETSGLIEVDSRVRFRHPLVRSAVYRAANTADRRRVHGALATATDASLDPDRRAWHAAQAVRGVDEEVAAELERSAGRARARGGFAAAGTFLRRSTELTPVVADRTRRALEAAQTMHVAGSSQAALDLLTIAEGGSPTALERGRVELLRAQIAFHLTRGAEAPGMLMNAAGSLSAVDPSLSRETYLHALDAAITSGSASVTTIAQAALDAPPSSVPGLLDQLLDGLAVTMVHGFSAGAPALRLAVEELSDAARPELVLEDRIQPWLWLAGRVAVGILDDERAHQLAECGVALSRRTGALAGLPAALNLHANILIISGQLGRAGELVDEAEMITRSTGGIQLHHAQALHAGWRGDRAALAELNSLTLQESINPEESGEAAMAHYASAVLHNGLGEYATAQEAATKAADVAELSLSTIGLPELIEASVRAGDAEGAARALERFAVRARASGTPWALGLEARSRALTLAGPAAEEQYVEAIAQLGRSRIAGDSARAHLVYGEWLRREGRRLEARAQLRTAHQLLSDMGIEAFASRAARELRATGEHPRKRTARRSEELTAQELHIARLAATGATSREIGAQLFLSPRTVDSHLRSIFRKLNISSRRQLKELRLA